MRYRCVCVCAFVCVCVCVVDFIVCRTPLFAYYTLFFVCGCVTCGQDALGSVTNYLSRILSLTCGICGI
jgi:hypothetical protein